MVSIDWVIMKMFPSRYSSSNLWRICIYSPKNTPVSRTPSLTMVLNVCLVPQCDLLIVFQSLPKKKIIFKSVQLWFQFWFIFTSTYPEMNIFARWKNESLLTRTRPLLLNSVQIITSSFRVPISVLLALNLASWLIYNIKKFNVFRD
jgi:hypothetical protein